ncbi:hypothetical protein CPY51_06945 [Rhizobium tubonense]|uniref:Uncharacterized protein n=1 Tax=Rhizobium tubonense TaxID=484088 RepID=A0A2W4CZR7_9HYPH|nr:hypothetical protein CPY51_06945 [Rhizobium tubonense]
MSASQRRDISRIGIGTQNEGHLSDDQSKRVLSWRAEASRINGENVDGIDGIVFQDAHQSAVGALLR